MAAALSVGAATVQAQSIRGVVRDTTAHQPVIGAVLLVLDSAGTTLARNITDPAGAFRFQSTPEMRRLRVLRIGFRPREVALPAGGDVELDIAMAALPTLLEKVQITTGASCSRRDDRLSALALLDQARAGLLATVVAREARPAAMIRLRYSTVLDAFGEKGVHKVTVDSTSDLVASFKAVRSAADFVKLGFLDTTRSADILYGPDAETLLDDSFRDGYCFQLHDRDARRPTSVGLAFAPAKRSGGRIDIEGTLWVDTAARKLDRVEFEYVGFAQSMQKMHFGGDIRFHDAGNGVVLIDRWSLRIPTSVVETVTVSRSQQVARARVGVQESGGAVASAQWPDGFQWRAALPAARFHVKDEKGQPVHGAAIVIDSTDYRALSDAAGVAVVDRMLPGRYEGAVFDPKLLAIGVRLTTPLKFTVSERDSADVTVKTLSPLEYVGEACKREWAELPIDRKGAWIMARVVDADSRPVKLAQWRVSRSVDGAWTPVAGAQGTTSSAGLLEYCGGGLHVGDEARVESRWSLDDPWHATTFRIESPLSAVIVIIPLRDGRQ
jgi:hypothetical protein